ncbi:hypothetical protein ACH3VR_17965 [Microbacterium sp. B2969]|uniref:Uncharacterized protein n=1 Tax=Microbacterium alkaliflavum TaxID=3248839 RepID=A0ABW7QCT1_9MICO
MTHAREPQHPLEWYRDVDGRGVDARLHLLDRQILDRDGVPVSTVDDIELDGVAVGGSPDPESPPVVTAILVGAAVLPRIAGGHIPRSQWDRLPWKDVKRLGSALELSVKADDLDATWVERWVRDRIIARIPGGRHAPE